ncbi:hypothetical protein HK405_003546, partial [Cladochytrium tenue]
MLRDHSHDRSCDRSHDLSRDRSYEREEERSRIRGVGLTEWDHFVKRKICPVLAKMRFARFLKPGNYFATFQAFNVHLLAKLGPETSNPDPSGSGSSDAADKTMVVDTPKTASRKETLARLKDYENHIEDAESALAIFEGFVAPTVLEHIED